jgi:hypothetical protein
VVTSPARLITAVLILAAAATFLISTVMERHVGSAEQVPRPPGRAAPMIAGYPEARHAEPLFGVDVESGPLVVGAVAASVVLVVALLTITSAWAAVVIALVMLALTALDILTVIHDVGQPGGAPGDILAVVVMMLHVLACFIVAYGVRPSTTGAAWRR